MKNLLIIILFALAAIGCGTSYLLLRMPDNVVTELIVKRLSVTETPAVAPSAPVAAPSAPVAAPSAPVAAPTLAPVVAAGAPAAAKSKPEVRPEQPKDDGKVWKGLAVDDWYAGKKLSEKDFDGKVVLVYAWSSKEKPSVEMLSRIEEIWSSFKTKPLVVVGSHRGGRNPKIPNAYRKLELTFPMYEGMGFAKEPLVSQYPYIYIVNHHGKVVYRGSSDRSATEALVTAVTACILKQ